MTKNKQNIRERLKAYWPNILAVALSAAMIVSAFAWNWKIALFASILMVVGIGLSLLINQLLKTGESNE